MTKGAGGTPAGRRTSLLVRMGNAARDAGVVPPRIHLVVAVDRLLVRLLAAAPGRWAVKGGYANQLRRPGDALYDWRLFDLLDEVRAKWEGGRPAGPTPPRSTRPAGPPPSRSCVLVPRPREPTFAPDGAGSARCPNLAHGPRPHGPQLSARLDALITNPIARGEPDARECAALTVDLDNPGARECLADLVAEGRLGRPGWAIVETGSPASSPRALHLSAADLFAAFEEQRRRTPHVPWPGRRAMPSRLRTRPRATAQSWQYR